MDYKIAALVFMLAGCTKPMPPATEVRIQRETVEVVRICPDRLPDRPAPLVRPLPQDAEKFGAVHQAKLLEYAGPGKYVDTIERTYNACKASKP